MAGQPTRCPSRPLTALVALLPIAGALRALIALLACVPIAVALTDDRHAAATCELGDPHEAVTEAGADAEHAGVLLPPGFVHETLPHQFTQATGLIFAPDGRLFVWEKGGILRLIVDGVMQTTPVLDISDEVAYWGDHGLMSVALHPDFASNGYIYALYGVDWHHVETFGTPAYDPAFSLDFHDTIGRVTRFRCAQIGGEFVALTSSRRVLLGEDGTSGIPLCDVTHGLGQLVFGEDGTLLVSTGDSHAGGGSGHCGSNGVLGPSEHVDLFRSQLVDSLSGKILRLNAETGNGVHSNPFFDLLAPRAPRSRVWALGLRNPFRFTLRPGTGQPLPWQGRPGTLMISDVGGSHAEELNVVRFGGENLGWPVFEGLGEAPFALPATANPDAPNELFGMGGCAQSHFHFQDLIVQDDLPPAPHVNPCDPGFAVPASIPTFVHRRPALDWLHGVGPARVPGHDAGGFATEIALGSPGAPVAGPPFSGGCASAVAFHPGGGFPAEYTGLLFLADFTAGWIRTVEFDALDRPVRVEPFAVGTGAVVALAVHPLEGWLYGLDYGQLGDTRLFRVRLVTDNEPPQAVAKLSPGFGSAPLAVTFDGTASSDPEGAPLAHRWSFGDGSFESRLPAPVRILPSTDISALGTIVARVDELSPPAPMGFGSKNKETVRDGVLPVPGQNEPELQYDTLHVSLPDLLPDKGGIDWIGYVFPGERIFTGLIFQEGLHFGVGGGWFETLGVQVLRDGEWIDIPDFICDPPYDHGADPPWDVFELRFPPVAGEGLRIIGIPGGLYEFVSVGELRVLALHEPLPATPMTVPVVLTVTDDVAQPAVANVSVSLNNHPPVAQILSPANGSVYPAGVLSQIPLVGLATDPDGDDVTCTWEILLHHQSHTHPEPPQVGCEGLATVQPHGTVGEVHYYRVRFTVTDAWGLSDTAVIWLLPDNDLNLNGIPDADEIAAGTAKDSNFNGIPDEAESDCNGDGVNDAASLVIGLERDTDEDGIPDDCDPILTRFVQKP